MPDSINHQLQRNPLSLKPWPRAAFLFLCLGIFTVNIVRLGIDLREKQKIRAIHPYIFLGNKFLGLNQILNAVTRVGYLTDKDMDDRVNAMEFAQAKYTLAPITLDLNNPGHEYLLLVCSSPEAAVKIVQKLRLTPLKQNLFGIILAKNPKGANP